MIRTAVFAIAFLLGGCAPSAAAPPRLTVLLVIDQLPADVFERHPRLTGGFDRLRRHGFRYVNARLRHIPTETAPGHAAIATGRPPSIHGIIGNDWYDRRTATSVTSTEGTSSNDPRSAGRVLAPTLADAVQSRWPEARVVSVAGKDRAAVLMGGQTPDLAAWYGSKERRFVGIGALSLLKRLDTSPANTAIHRRTRDLNRAKLQEFSGTTEPDAFVLKLAAELIHDLRLGTSSTPDLLLIGLSATDYNGHMYGPDDHRMATHLQSLDLELARFLTLLEEASSGDFVLVVTSDHGVLPLPGSPAGQAAGARRVRKTDWRNALERAFQERFPRQDRWIISATVPDIWLNRPPETTEAEWSEMRAALGVAAEKVTGVARVYVPPVFPPEDEFSAVYRRSYHPDRSGDLLIRMKTGLLVTNFTRGTSHGSPYDYDSRIPLVFFGPRFAVGISTRSVSAEDIAPTVAELLTAPLEPFPDGGGLLSEAILPRKTPPFRGNSRP